MQSDVNRDSGTVVIRGAYGKCNFGDDALTVAAHEIVKRALPSASICFQCARSDYLELLVPDAKPSLHWKPNGEHLDVFVLGGGTQFYSFPLTRKRGLCAYGGRVWRHLGHPVRLAQRLTGRTADSLRLAYTAPNAVAIGIGLGPFINNCSYVGKIRNLLAQMKYVAVRDTCSYNLCREWGLANVFLRSDLCYLPGLWNPCTICGPSCRPASGISRIAVIPRDWPHTWEGDSYAEPLFQSVDLFRSRGKHVEFVSFANTYDRNWAKRLKQRGESYKAWNPETQSIEDFLTVLSKFDAFITARYHGAVFASLLRKPVVCIEVEQKLRLVADSLGDGSRLWSPQFAALDCVQAIGDLEKSYPRAVAQLEAAVAEQSTLAARMIGELARALSR